MYTLANMCLNIATFCWLMCTLFRDQVSSQRQWKSLELSYFQENLYEQNFCPEITELSHSMLVE